MRWKFGLFLILMAFVSLCGCSKDAQTEQIQVSVVESGQFTVQGNGVWIEPGENAEFFLYTAPKDRILSVDYQGEYRLSDTDGAVKLELFDVRYPTRVAVHVLSNYRTICYESNGGIGIDGTTSSVAKSYDVSEHIRPNTSIGADLFTRDGYTLVGWNTAPDGTGVRIGLGSRATVPDQGLTLYAQWAEWTALSHFTYQKEGEEIVITGYTGNDTVITVPEFIDDLPVRRIAGGAFRNCVADAVILPKSLRRVENGGFLFCMLRSLTLFDDIEYLSDDSIRGCPNLSTLHINAVEDPYGYLYRRESVYADKVDMLIRAQGRKKLVFYAGCSMWYNLEGQAAANYFRDEYAVINMGLNGMCNSLVQMEIMEHFLERGDIFFHAPELSSPQQLLTHTAMTEDDDKLWCGLEYNYDLVGLVDIRDISGIFDSWMLYREKKRPGGSYEQVYRDSDERNYLDDTGSIPFSRTEQQERLVDEVGLDLSMMDSGLPMLRETYDRYGAKGIQVFVSYGCVDIDAVPQEERGQVQAMDDRFRKIIAGTESAVLVSTLWDYLYNDADFYDTVYHMLTPAAQQNTERWLRDLSAWIK